MHEGNAPQGERRDPECEDGIADTIVPRLTLRVRTQNWRSQLLLPRTKMGRHRPEDVFR